MKDKRRNVRIRLLVVLLIVAIFCMEQEMLVWAEDAGRDNATKIEDVKLDNNVIDVSLGGHHSALITINGDLYCWGYNKHGQVGTGTTENQIVPVKILSDVKSVSLSSTYSAAITVNGDLYCWGENYYGQIGNGTRLDQTIPVKVLSNVKYVSLGDAHSAAITENGDLYCWGDNSGGEVGNGTKSGCTTTPAKVLSNVVDVNLGFRYSAAITANGDLYCWGLNGRSGTYKTIPEKILSNVVSVSLGNAHNAAITANGDLYCWGDNSDGGVGNGTTTKQNVPVKVLDNVASVSISTCSAAITMDGGLYCWGDNRWGQVGNGTTTDQLVPIKVLDNVTSISSGGCNAAITMDGDLYCWGYNYAGQVGNGTTINQKTPIKVFSNVKSVFIGDAGMHRAAITTDGDLYCWGYNLDGQVGNSTTMNQLRPVKVFGNITLDNKEESEGSETDSINCNLRTVTYSYGNKSIDVLTTAHSIETSHKPFDIICTPKDSSSVTKYALYSGNKKICESTNGKFEKVDASKFTSGKDISIKVYGRKKAVTTQLLLEIKDKNPLVKPTLKLGGKDGLSLALNDDVPFIGGNDISVELPEIPVNVVVEDGKIKIGINIKEKELYSANSYEGVTTTTKRKKKTMKQIISDMKYTLYKTGNINKDWKGYLEKSNLKADMPLMEQKTTFTVFGYAEAEWSDTLETVSGEIVVAISGNTTFQKQSVILYIPVTVNCKVTGNGEVDAEVKYDFVNQEWSGNVKFDGSVEVEPYAGAGVGTWLSVGVYGQAKIGIRITLLTFIPPTKEKGVDDIYLSGETGIKGYFATKEVKVPLLSLKNLKKTGLGKYINNNDELLIYSKNENSLINKKSARSMVVDFSNAEFIWSENKASRFRSMPTGDMEAATLVGNAYGAAEPQIITVNGTTLIAYLDNDDNREISNQTVVKYAVYDAESGKFSTPRVAVDDNTADYKPQLFTDGTDIYLYYLDSTKSYGSDEDPDIHEYAGTFAVTVEKYDTDSDSFIKLGTISRTGHYCYAPTLERREEGLFLVWAENESDDVFGLTEDNSINYAVFSGEAWSDPMCIAEDLNSITSISSGKLGDDETIAYSIDIDNDLTTAGQKLCFADESGTIAELVEGSITDLQYINLPESDQPVLAFNHNGAVEYIKAVSGSLVKLLEEETMDAGSRFVVLDDRIYYLKTTDENSRNLYCASYADGQWGSVALTDESAYVDAFSVADDKLVYLLTDADFSEDESGDGEIITSSDIKFLASTEKHDLKIENVDFDALNINAGEDLNLELSITNNGTEIVENPVVSFYLKSNSASSQNVTFSSSIHPGETVQENIVVTAPTDFSDAVYAVKVEEEGYADIRETDNVEEVDLSKTELEIETEYKIIEDKKSLAVYVSNDSNVSSEASVMVTESDGSVIYTEENISVSANSRVDISVPLDELQLDENGETVLTASVSTDAEEYYICNNTYEQRIWEIDTWKPVVSNISDEEEDNGNNDPGKGPSGNSSNSTVKKPSVSKVKSFKAKAGKKKLTLSWKKISGIDGYQIQISTKKNFKGAKTISISKSKKKYTKKGLKAGKKYFVRIRACKTYKDANGKTQKAYGKWVKTSKKTK